MLPFEMSDMTDSVTRAVPGYMGVHSFPVMEAKQITGFFLGK